MRLDRAGSIQTHVGTFPKICVFYQILLHFRLENVILFTLWADFLVYSFDIDNYIGKTPPKVQK